jgi:hypothetical protein
MKVEILMGEITKLTTKTRIEEGLTTTISFDAKIPVASVARLLNSSHHGPGDHGGPWSGEDGSQRVPPDIMKQNSILSEDHEARGLYIEEDEHHIYLMYKGKVIGQWWLPTARLVAIRTVARSWALRHDKEKRAG